MTGSKGRYVNPNYVMPTGKLIDLKDEKIGRGAIFRLIGEWPYEDIVDFMLFDAVGQDAAFGLITVTGYKAGLQCNNLPDECLLEGTRMLSTKWIINNWEKWIYPECPVEEVYYRPHYTAPNTRSFSN